MAVLVASLFLPFKPQFEIDASVNEAAALLESQNIKIPTAANTASNTTVNTNANASTTNLAHMIPSTSEIGIVGAVGRASSASSSRRSSSLGKPKEFSPLAHTTTTSATTTAATTSSSANRKRSQSQILSRTKELETDTKEATDAFMESLTANATSSALETPKPSHSIAGMSTTVSEAASAVNLAQQNVGVPVSGPNILQHPAPSHNPSRLHHMAHQAEFTLEDSQSDFSPIPTGTPASLMQLQLGGGLTSHSTTPSLNLPSISSHGQQQQQQQQQIALHGQSKSALDPTATLLKNVSKNLAGNMSNNFNPPKPSHLSTVIMPKSRDLPVSEKFSGASQFRDLSKAPSTTSMRRIHRKSSGAAPPPALSKSLFLQGVQEHENEEENDLDESASKDSLLNNHSSSILGRPILSDQEKDEAIADETFFSDDGCESFSTFHKSEKNEPQLDNEVPAFGGYSNVNYVKESLLGGSQNIFSKASWEIVPSHKCNSGLKNAINTAILEKTFNQEIVWVGTLGVPTDTLPEDVLGKVATSLDEDYHCKTVVSDDITFKGAYKNFCKEILWPTFHYQIPDNPKSKAFEDHSWQHYQKLNQLFADKIVESYKDGDTVWVHDYHLLLVPGMVREKLPSAKIGFSLHVSFPSSEVFRCFAQRTNILQGLLGANTVGFQSDEYARHFLLTCNRLLMTDGDMEDGVKYSGRIIQVNTTPIGIDAFNLQRQLVDENVLACRQVIRNRWGQDKFIIVSKDQFDSLRGLKNKFLAYERFLKTNPQYIKKCCFIQVFNGSAIKDQDLEKDIVLIVDRINSLSNDISLVTQNVVLLHQQLEQEQYLALLTEADMFLVNSMREGMNLTCHDFVVCNQEKNSPLLISEFTGSAELMKKGCLLINPWDIRKVCEMIKIGLELSAEEKRRRWKKMMKQIIINDSDNWIVSMIKSINSSWELNKQRSTIFNLSYPELSSSYNSCKTRNKLFILKCSQPPTPAVLSMLNDLCVDNEVYVLNSFDKSIVERYYARVNNLNLIAENGAFVRIHGHWYTIMNDNSWARDVLPLLQDKLERLPGSYIKNGESMFRVHTENVEDQDRVDDVVGDLILHINSLFGSKRGVHAYYHKNIIFVQQYGLSMKAVKFIFSYYGSHAHELDSVMNNNGPMSPAKSPQMKRQISTGSGYFINGGDSSTSLSSLNLEDMKFRPKITPTPSFDNISALNTSQVGMVVDDKSGVNKFSFVWISGSSSPVIEPLFKYANDLNKRISYTFTCVYGDPSSTNAKQHVVGMNDLVKVLSNLCEAPSDSDN